MIAKEKFLGDLKELLKTDDEVVMDTDLMDIDNWDSFSMMAVLAMIEEKYGIQIEPFSIAGAVLVEDIYTALVEAFGGN